MKIPSSPTPIHLSLGPGKSTDEEGQESTELEKGVDLEPGDSLQKLVSFDLKEEGSHVLAVTVTYSETTPTSGRVRTFRKLYQFVCKGCMVVRTKTGLLPASAPGDGKPKGRKWALEAQLENIGEETITLDMVVLETTEQFRNQGVNWEIVVSGCQEGEASIPCRFAGRSVVVQCLDQIPSFRYRAVPGVSPPLSRFEIIA